MKRKVLVLLLCAAAVFFTTAAQAGPIPASPSPVNSAGESLLTSLVVGKASALNVDWMVISTNGTAFAPNLYAYLYQIENTTAVGVDILSLTVGKALIGTIVGAGVLAGDNLDLNTISHPGHSSANFGLLATESDPYPLQALTGVNTNINPGDGTVTWTFNPITPGNQTETMYFLSTNPPTYGNGLAQDSIPPSPWATLGVGAQPLPVPSAVIPEPGSFVLLGLGLGALVVGRRLRKS